MRFTPKTRAREAVADETRERRLDELRRIVEDFLFNLAMMVAGHDADFTNCTSRAVDQRLRAALEPLQAAGDTLRPDFGTHAELRVEGDLLDASVPVEARVEFEDRSLRQSTGWRGIAVPRRRITIALEVTLQPCQIVRYTVHVADIG